MTKYHAGTHHRQGTLMNRGTAPKPSPTHGGSGAKKGVTHGPPQPRQYTFHGGTSLAMGRLSGKRT
jgi:hypothetical protein